MTLRFLSVLALIACVLNMIAFHGDVEIMGWWAMASLAPIAILIYRKEKV